jgi:hypothetical protein
LDAGAPPSASPSANTARSPEEARRLAKRELGKVAQGLDPSGDRAACKEARTVRELGQDYLEDVRTRRKKTTAYEYERLWKKHVLPELGSKQVPSVIDQDIRRLHKSLSETPYTANRLHAMLGAFFSFAAKEGVIKAHENPAHGVEHLSGRSTQAISHAQRIQTSRRSAHPC